MVTLCLIATNAAIYSVRRIDTRSPQRVRWQNDIQRAQIYREFVKTILELKNTPTNTPPKLP